MKIKADDEEWRKRPFIYSFRKLTLIFNEDVINSFLNYVLMEYAVF